jgi:hypothetical protein
MNERHPGVVERQVIDVGPDSFNQSGYVNRLIQFHESTSAVPRIKTQTPRVRSPKARPNRRPLTGAPSESTSVSSSSSPRRTSRGIQGAPRSSSTVIGDSGDGTSPGAVVVSVLAATDTESDSGVVSNSPDSFATEASFEFECLDDATDFVDRGSPTVVFESGARNKRGTASRRSSMVQPLGTRSPSACF